MNSGSPKTMVVWVKANIIQLLLISLLLVVLIAGTSWMKGKQVVSVWIATKPLAVGQTVGESDVVAQRRPSQRKIDECAKTGTPTESPTPAATPVSGGTGAATSTPTTIPTPKVTTDPSAAPTEPAPTTISSKSPLLASDIVVGRQVVRAVPKGCPITTDNVEPLVRLVVPRQKIFANGIPINRDVLEVRELLAKYVPPKALADVTAVTGKIATVDLTAGRPITIGQVLVPTATPGASTPTPTPVAVAKSDLGAYQVLEDGDATTTSLTGRLLLAAVAEGKPILASNVVAMPSEVKPPLLVFALTAHGPTGLHSQLKPGDLVDIYVSPRVMTDSEGVPHILTPAETLTSPPLSNALVLASKAGIDDSFEVTLAVGDSHSDDLRRLLAVANQVDFTLVRRPQ